MKIPNRSRELAVAYTPRLFSNIAYARRESSNPTGAVLATLTDKELAKNGIVEVVLERSGYALVSGPAITPHHPLATEDSGHKVFWITRLEKQGKIALPNGHDHNVSLATKVDFWYAVQRFFKGESKTNPNLRFYLLMGHVDDRSRYQGIIGVYPYGTQSVSPLHFHSNLPIIREGILDPKLVSLDSGSLSKHHKFLLETFIASGGRSMRNLLNKSKINGYEHMVFSQLFNIFDENFSVDRPFFAFISLAEAYSAAIEMQLKTEKLWLAHVMAMGTFGETVSLGAIDILRKQSCVPNMTLMYLSESDKQFLGVSEDIMAVVFPFSITNPETVMETVLLDRSF